MTHLYQLLGLNKYHPSINSLESSLIKANPAGKKPQNISSQHPAVESTIILLAALALKKEIRIILADDDEDDRDLFAEAIEENFQVHFETAKDGSDLMKMIDSAKIPPDIIFLDLNMPGKNGKKCLEEIRGNKKLAKVHVVIYSTSISKKDIDDTFAMGANLYIRKPNTYKELTEVIKKVLAIDWNDHLAKTDKKNFLFSSKTN